MISNSGHDERGKYSGGQAGDQTGTEWQLINWYNRPWDTVFHYPDVRVRQLIAELAIEAAENPLIGYDQNQRTTFWEALKATGTYHPKDITTPCEADCSAGVAAICKAVGYILGITALKNISPDMYTGSEKTILQQAGFETLTEKKYLTSDAYLYAGDILLCTGHHTCINVTDGEKVATPSYQIGWNKDDVGWWYADTTKTYYADTWAVINGCWYWFDEEGYAVTGAQTIGGKLYYFCAEPGAEKECALMKTDSSGALYVWTGVDDPETKKKTKQE